MSKLPLLLPLWLAALAAVAIGVIGPASAQEERRYRDWTLRCDVMAETHQRVCWIYNDATQNGVGLASPVTVSASIGFVPDNENLAAFFHICPPAAPAGSTLIVNVDDEKIAELPLEFSSDVDCQYARSSEDGEAATDLLSALRRGLEGQFQIVGPNDFDITVPLSLLGLTRALRSMEAILETS